MVKEIQVAEVNEEEEEEETDQQPDMLQDREQWTYQETLLIALDDILVSYHQKNRKRL